MIPVKNISIADLQQLRNNLPPQDDLTYVRKIAVLYVSTIQHCKAQGDTRENPKVLNKVAITLYPSNRQAAEFKSAVGIFWKQFGKII